ncbi:MAG: dual specificity protein phosphatase family protein [Oscillochloris sp.]|nr:dual specificity protein phosphatase family protein [Oscillochloris sp.]
MLLFLRTQWQRFFSLNISPVSQLLFVGGQFQPEQWPQIHAVGVRAVLSMQAERIDQFSEPLPERFHRLEVRDFHPPSLEQLAEGVAFIAAAHAEGLPVFVHCHAGVGRAPIMAAAYLVASEGLSSREALRLIQMARPIIRPNLLQLARLREYEARLSNGTMF